MATDLTITSLQNPKVKETVDLRERREREKKGLFLIEGYRELCRAVDAQVTLDFLWYCPELFLGCNEEKLIAQARAAGCPVYRCPKKVFCKLSYRDRPDGLLAVAKQMRRSLESLTSCHFLLVAEAIEKPGNLGTMLRSADAVHVDGVVVCDRCTDIYNPNVVRASTGTLFTVPVIEATGEDTLVWLREKGVQIVAATPSAQQEYTEAPLQGPLAIVVGTEQVGLSARWLQAADLQVRIPMLGKADSLNVATATTLLLYEVVRQRKYGR